MAEEQAESRYKRSRVLSFVGNDYEWELVTLNKLMQAHRPGHAPINAQAVFRIQKRDGRIVVVWDVEQNTWVACATILACPSLTLNEALVRDYCVLVGPDEHEVRTQLEAGLDDYASEVEVEQAFLTCSDESERTRLREFGWEELGEDCRIMIKRFSQLQPAA